MSFLNRWLSTSRMRGASKRVAKQPTARAYAELAQEHAVLGDMDAVIQVTDEALKLFPGDAELKRLAERSRSLKVDGRIRELSQELRQAPRPALRRELCELLLEVGRVARAEEVASEWFQSNRDGEALYFRARARAERFFADRRRDDGRLAFDLVTSAAEAMPGDVRPLKLHVELASRCGAWGEARRILARLLEHLPGDPATEARFRTVAALADTGKTVDQALREVEKTGHLAGEDGPTEPRTSATNKSIRPLLKRLIQEDGVEAAFFVRGATALVQGKKGATAERTARGVRDIVSSCRTAARKLGLGQAHEVRIEGEFGTLLVAPSEQGSGALWCLGGITRRHDECLRELAGAALNTPEEEA